MEYIFDLQLCVFTYNLGSFNKIYGGSKLFEDLLSEFSKVFTKNPNNIWIISTEEDRKKSIFCEQLKIYFIPNTIHKNNTGLKTPLMESYLSQAELKDETQYMLLKHDSIGMPGTNFWVHQLIFVPKSYESLITLFSIAHVTHSPRSQAYLPEQSQNSTLTKVKGKVKKLLKTKNSIINKLQIVFGDESINLYCVSSHLPIDTKMEDLGYPLRVKAINTVLDQINNNIEISNSNTGNNALLWAGDLNFRLSVDGDLKSNQLSDFITHMKTNPIKLKDLTMISGFGPTCKTSVFKIKKGNTISKKTGSSMSRILSRTKTHKLLNPKANNACKKIYKTRQQYLETDYKTKNKCYVLNTKAKNNNTLETTHKISPDEKFSGYGENVVSNTSSVTQNTKKYNTVANYNTNNNKNTNNTIVNTNNNKGHGQRIPSYCDRILGWSQGKYDINPIKVEPVVEHFFTHVSDHNPIVGYYKFINKIKEIKETLV
jgi:hypothetical protein